MTIFRLCSYFNGKLRARKRRASLPTTVSLSLHKQASGMFANTSFIQLILA